MSRWRIVSRGGIDLGTYEAATAADSLDALAQDAGYESHIDACDAIDAYDESWTTSAWDFSCGGYDLLVEEVKS